MSTTSASAAQGSHCWLLGYQDAFGREWHLHLIIVGVPPGEAPTYDLFEAAGFSPANGYCDGAWMGYDLFRTDGHCRYGPDGEPRELRGSLVSHLRWIMKGEDAEARLARAEMVVRFAKLRGMATAPVLDEEMAVSPAAPESRRSFVVDLARDYREMDVGPSIQPFPTSIEPFSLLVPSDVRRLTRRFEAIAREVGAVRVDLDMNCFNELGPMRLLTGAAALLPPPGASATFEIPFRRRELRDGVLTDRCAICHGALICLHDDTEPGETRVEVDPWVPGVQLYLQRVLDRLAADYPEVAAQLPPWTASELAELAAASPSVPAGVANQRRKAEELRAFVASLPDLEGEQFPLKTEAWRIGAWLRHYLEHNIAHIAREDGLVYLTAHYLETGPASAEAWLDGWTRPEVDRTAGAKPNFPGVVRFSLFKAAATLARVEVSYHRWAAGYYAGLRAAMPSSWLVLPLLADAAAPGCKATQPETPPEGNEAPVPEPTAPSKRKRGGRRRVLALSGQMPSSRGWKWPSWLDR